MAQGVNTFFGIGNLGQDIEMRYAPSGTAVASASCAFTEKRGQEERTTWIQLKFFNKLAEVADKYLQKGTKVFVRGRIQIDEWQHKQYPEVKMQRATLLVDELRFLSGTKGDDNAQSPVRQQNAQQNTFDDDIPF